MITVAVEDNGIALPGWVLRGAAAVTSAGIVAVIATEGAPAALLVVLALLGASGVLSPSSAAPAALGGVAAVVSTVYQAGGVLRPSVFALVFLVHLLHVVCGLASVVPRGARLHTTALRRPLWRFLLIQLAVLAMAGVATVLPPGPNSAELEIVAILAVAAVAVLAIALLRRR